MKEKSTVVLNREEILKKLQEACNCLRSTAETPNYEGLPQIMSLMVGKMSTRDVALAYGSLGFKVFPCNREQGKTPPEGFSWPRRATADGSAIQRLWGKYPDGTVALPMTLNGLFAVDVDQQKPNDINPETGEVLKESGFKWLNAYEQEHGALDTLTVETPSGGRHYIFLKPEGIELKNSSNELADHVDTRSDGYLIAVGSMRDGKAYHVIKAAPPAAIPDALLAILPRKGEAKKAAPLPMVDNSTPAQHEPISNSDNLGVVMPTADEQRQNLQERLVKWAQNALQQNCADIRQETEGNRNNMLNEKGLRSYQLAHILSEETVTEALFVAGTECGLPQNSVRATLNSAKKKGMEQPRVPDWYETERQAILSAKQPTQTYSPTGKKNEVFQPKVKAPAEPAQPEPWGELMPFGGGKIPQFNADYLPPLLADFCSELAEELQVPLELPVAMALPSIATAAQRRYVVRIKGNYTETLNVWTLCPLPPANRKTAVVSACTAPLIEWEGKKGEEVALKIRMADRLIEVQVGRIADVEKQLRRSEDEAECAELIKKLEELEAGMPERPVMPQLLVDDTTPEALARVLDAQAQCAGMISAEGGIFDILAGLYSGGTANLTVFLKAHSGKESYKVNRAGGTFINLSHACLSMGISPQPYVLKKRQAAERFRGLGFDGRFLYFLPKSLLGHRKLESNEMSQQTMQAYRNKILSLLPPINKETAQPCSMGEAENTATDGARRQDIKTSDGRTVLELSEGAYEVWLNYKAKLEPALDEEEGEFKDMTDWAGKTTGTLARIAGLYHIATYDDPAEYPIQKATMEQALYLMTFCSLHAKLAYEMMGEGGAIPCAKEILKWITKGKSKSFTIVQCRQRFKNATAFKEEGAIERALKELEERNYIRQTAAAAYKGRGARPKETYEVNPAAFEEGK